MRTVDKSSTIVDEMSTKGLASVIFGRTRRLLLRELVLAAQEPVHLRELARRSGLDPSGLKRELGSLSQAGVVLEETAGNQKTYRLNRRCPIYNELRMIILKTVGLADELRTALQPLGSKITKAFIYGSIASGTETSKSDVDLMVVGDASLREVVGAVSESARRLGRVINPTVLRQKEYSRQLEEQGSFVDRITSGPRIELIGEEYES